MSFCKPIFTAACLLSVLVSQSQASVLNGSFESGFTGWTTQDLSPPFFPLQVGGAGITSGFGFFSSAPTAGSFAALHGFDGNGPGTIRIQQDILVSAGMEVINFDYRGAWNLIDFAGANTLDRIFDVNIEQAGGGANLLNQNILIAQAGTTVLDTGNLSGSVDLSSFIGQNVRLSFDWFVPQNFTGPAFFQLDNVTTSTAGPGAIPEPMSLIIWGLLGAVGLKRRRR